MYSRNFVAKIYFNNNSEKIITEFVNKLYEIVSQLHSSIFYKYLFLVLWFNISVKTVLCEIDWISTYKYNSPQKYKYIPVEKIIQLENNKQFTTKVFLNISQHKLIKFRNIIISFITINFINWVPAL